MQREKNLEYLLKELEGLFIFEFLLKSFLLIKIFNLKTKKYFIEMNLTY